MKLPDPETLDRLAGEYVLGTLRGPARRRFERWMREQPSLHAQVQAWESRLVPLAAAVPPRPAPAGTWEALQARLFGAPPVPAARRWAMWLATAWATTATLVLAVVAGLWWAAPERLVSTETLARHTQQLPASYMAVLSDDQGRPVLLASAARHASLLDLKVLRPGQHEPGTRHVLWAHTEGGERFALGVVDLQARGRIQMAGSAEQLLSKVATLSVTAEPEAAELPAQPTRLALLSGPCVKVW